MWEKTERKVTQKEKKADREMRENETPRAGREEMSESKKLTSEKGKSAAYEPNEKAKERMRKGSDRYYRSFFALISTV